MTDDIKPNASLARDSYDDKFQSMYAQRVRERDALQAQCDALAEALEFYAKPDNLCDGWGAKIVFDATAFRKSNIRAHTKASQALAEYKGGGV